MDIGQGQLSYAIWLQLPPEVRHKLVILFNIPRSGSTVVDYRVGGAVVTSDGYTAPDLQSISLYRMQALLDSDSDNFYKLFEEAVTNIDALLGGTFVHTVVLSSPVATAPDERVLTPGNVFHTSAAEAATVLHWEETPQKKFCDQCDSKGGRHKKVCPKY